MEKEFIIIIFSENKVGLLSQITTVFTHRNVNIDSLTASESAIEGIYKYTIMVKNDPDRVENLVKQIEKKIDVLKVFCYTPDEVVLQELALYKVQRSRNVEELVRRHNVRILEIHDDYIVLEKTGHRNEIQSLYRMLEPYGVYQFVRSGTGGNHQVAPRAAERVSRPCERPLPPFPRLATGTERRHQRRQTIAYGNGISNIKYLNKNMAAAASRSKQRKNTENTQLST